jgi:transcriptional regulator with XRE-family HTH domain
LPARRPPPFAASSVHRAVVSALVDARKRAGMTQREVSLAIGRPPSFLAKIERAERNISVLEALRIAQVLGTSVGQLLTPVEASLPDRFEI